MNTRFVQQIKEVKKGVALPSFLIAYFLKKVSSKNAIIIGPKNEIEELQKFYALFGKKFLRIPPVYEYENATKDEKKQITELLLALISNSPLVADYLISADAFSVSFPEPKMLHRKSIAFAIGSDIDIFKIARMLTEIHYEREEKSLTKGSFAIRGDVIELFSAQYTCPLRIETHFGVIESIYFFDYKTQKKREQQKTVLVSPVFLNEAHGKLEEYISLGLQVQNHNLVEIDSSSIIESIDPLEDGSKDIYQSATSHALNRYAFDPFDEEIEPTSKDIHSYHSARDLFFEQFKTNRHFTKIVLTHAPEKMKDIFENQHFETSLVKPEDIETIFMVDLKLVNIINISALGIRNLPKGFIDSFSEVIVATDKDLIVKKIPQKRTEVDETFIASLAPGDYIVHIDHGIGRFTGMVKRPIDGGMREFFLIEYGKGDKVYLPVEYADKIAKYVGEASPRVNRLHEVNFKHVKQKIKEDARKIAQELIDTQTLRELHDGFPFAKTDVEDMFMKSFPFVDTDCQTIAWKEVQEDLKSDQPMDRLLCGDVGFGKTEIAMRASFRVVSNGSQVGVLAPTTILAKQHYENFKKRFEDFNYTIELISRLQNTKKQKEIIEDLKNGKIDILIGTHRLISADIIFENLGLIVIDEEQRFGVKAKEALKKLRSKADILTLTATPIPRTLHMSLSGLRHISTLTTPPSGRIPIKTIISRRSDAAIKSAIEKELSTKGQVFYLHNRVQTIEVAKRKLEELIPGAKMSIVHGQLDPKKISDVMSRFKKGEIDVLVTSSIIENGVDIPNVNTLIVADATRFGLGQLYQLRGRIGRSEKKGFAYFLYNNQSLSQPAKERLKALLAAKKLGSGFEIAMKDLEMRGTGNILGKEQSGRVKTLGLSHYLKLLNTAIKEAQTGETIKELDVSIDLPLNAFIPDELVENEQEKLTLYQRLANIDSIDRLLNKKSELLTDVDSEEFENLFFILELKLIAKKADIKNIDTKIFLNPDGSQYKKIVVSFDTKTDYKKAYKAIERYSHLEVEEKSVKISARALGNDWKKTLKEIITLFSIKTNE